MSDDELLTGQRGLEHDAGYSPMPLPEPPDPEPIMDQHMLEHFDRPAPPEPISRVYQNLDSGEERPPNEVVPLERAADDLRDIREREAKQIDDEAREALSRALDGEQPAQDQQPEPDIQPQPEADPSYAQPGPDPEVERALQNPKVREAVANQLKQYEAVASYAQNHFVAAANAFLQNSEALALVNFPELAPFAGNQQAMSGALAVLAKENPARFAEVQDFTNKVSLVAERAQRAQIEQQQAVQQRQQQEFQRYAAEQDARAFSKTPPEELRAIREFLYVDAEKAGISRAQVNQHWSNNVALRHSYISELLADGAKYRMARQGMKSARHNPIPQVQRPGISEGGPRDDGELSSLQARFNLNPTRELAAALIGARRNAR